MCSTYVARFDLVHSFGLPLINGMHRTQSDHESLMFENMKLMQSSSIVLQSDHEHLDLQSHGTYETWVHPRWKGFSEGVA